VDIDSSGCIETRDFRSFLFGRKIWLLHTLEKGILCPIHHFLPWNGITKPWVRYEAECMRPCSRKCNWVLVAMDLVFHTRSSSDSREFQLVTNQSIDLVREQSTHGVYKGRYQVWVIWMVRSDETRVRLGLRLRVRGRDNNSTGVVS